MEIVEVRIKLMVNCGRLKALSSITFGGGLVLGDLKIIEGRKGLFVQFPIRKLTNRCPCGHSNELRARYCNDCGSRLDDNRATLDLYGYPRLHIDVIYPNNPACRALIESKVLPAYYHEVQISQKIGYVHDNAPTEDCDHDDANINPYIRRAE
jgi:stage V sporulation protein G